MSYRVICKPAGQGQYDYYVANIPSGRPVQGRSASPLFDACRKLQRMGVPAMMRVTLFHEGSKDWSVRCPVWAGEKLMVSHTRFAKRHD